MAALRRLRTVDGAEGPLEWVIVVEESLSDVPDAAQDPIS